MQEWSLLLYFLVPQLVSQTARQFDPYRRRITSPMEALESRIPGLTNTLHPVIGPWGQPVAGHSTVGPHVREPDPVNDRMLALGLGVAPWPKSIKGVPLNADEFERYARLAGTLRHQMLLPLVTAPGFSQRPVPMQVEQIRQTIRQARERAITTLQAEYPRLFYDGLLLKSRITR